MADLTTTYAVDCNLNCKLDEGLTAPCDPGSAGGNDTSILIVDLCDVVSTTDNYTDNIIDGITLAEGAVWKLVQANPDSVSVTETINEIRGFKTAEISFQITAVADALTTDSGAQAVKDFVDKISNPYNKYVIVLENNAGFKVVYGLNRRGMRIAAGSQYESGSAFADFNGYTVKFTGVDFHMAPILSADATLATS